MVRSSDFDSSTILGHQKTFILWLVILGVLVNTALAGVCLCGDACAYSLRSNPFARLNSPIHMQCAGMTCKSCELEQFQNLKGVNSTIEALSLKSLGDLSIPLGHLSDPPKHNPDKTTPSCTVPTVSSSPLYLLQISFLC